MKKDLLKLFLILVFLFFIQSCNKDNDFGKDNYLQTDYHINVPDGFPPPLIGDKKLTFEGIKLGRMLYYDPILSSNGLSCSSCHNPSKSFSSAFHIHPDGERTSIPVHVNLAWKTSFLWEGGLPSIEDVCIGDFEPEFFNTDMTVLVNRLITHEQYPKLFYEAFQIQSISGLTHHELKLKIIDAIAQFMNTMISNNSKYDQFRRQEINLSQDELRGYIIFNTEEGDCFHCHGSVLYSDYRLHNNGLDENPIGRDMGNFNFSNDSNNIGKFISPTLRNIDLSAPYMHDGRFQTLEEVVEFYNSGVYLNSPNIDPIMTKPFKLNGLQLTNYDKSCLVKFLKTFTDTAFIQHPDYQSPF